ncbi:sensor domain-containing diguanylate cyclase [Thalassotalea euphylliae]|uniref:diguanylate cyclase n=1 Tax=Thalassotalea euphylliae TaxID=1655234 RepID=A0A3E0TMU2_9GAMM|nr:sensor domain-containing diguanylate cyclase [Thalassotalea euphylliae]REL25462.1 sensor domain-containing diguanylate cyclase [Thalassotalea euphylliae]
MSVSENYLKKELYSLVREDENIFEFLQSGATDGMWYWDLEQPENEWMNPQFWTELGYDPAEKSHRADEWQGIINQDDLQLALENFQKHCDNPDHPYDQEVRYRHKDGSTVWIRCRGIVIRNSDNQPYRMLGAHSNITALKESEAQHRKSLKQLDHAYASIKLALEESERLFEMAPDANLKLDIRGNILKANQQAEELFNCPRTQLEQLSVFSLVPLAKLEKYQQAFKKYFDPCYAKDRVFKKSLAIIDYAGLPLTIEVTLNLIPTRTGKIALATIRDVSEKEALIQSLQHQLEENRKLHALALSDPLTKIFNKRHFNNMMLEEHNKAVRHQQCLSLILFDIDHFKTVNDTYGHDVGDKVLTQLTELIRGLVREEDTFARIGGEEFAIITPFTNSDAALTIAERIVEECAKHQFVINDQQLLNITVSVGTTTLNNTDKTWPPLFERADKALYQAKRLGRNQAQLSTLF